MFRDQGRPISIKHKIAALVFIVCVVALLFSSILSFLYELGGVKRAKLQEATTMANVVGASLTAAILFRDEAAASELLSAFRRAPEIDSAVLITSDGKTLARYLADGVTPDPTLLEQAPGTHRFTGGMLQLAIPISEGREPVGTLFVGGNLAGLRVWRSSKLSSVVVILLTGALMALVMATFVGRRVVRPVTMLTELMSTVTRSRDYSARMSYSGNDEFGSLAQRFNDLLAELSERDSRLRRYQDSLEDKVAQRTAELTEEVAQRTAIEAALRREREQLLDVIRASPVAIAMLDGEMRYVAHSEAWIEEFELGSRDIIGRNHYEIFPDVPERWREIHARTLRGQCEQADEDTFERADGSRLHLRWAIRPWYTPDGVQGGIIMVTLRIDELVKAREDALHTAELKSQFIANMSHELRTPLNSIIGFTDLLLDNRQLVAEQKLYLEAVRSSSAVLLSVIGDILDFSKLERGSVELERIAFSPDALLDNVVSMVLANAEKKSLFVHLDSGPPLPPKLRGDPFRIQQILLNLLGNAIKFTSQGGVSLSARVLERSTTSTVIQFSVRDTGIGIPLEKLTAIFDPFSQGDGSTTRKFGGTGLGLSISRQLVTLMNGRIWAESRELEGSTFHFTAALENPPAEKDTETRETSRPLSGTHPAPLPQPALHTRLNILLAEDNSLNQKLFESILKKAGHQLTIVDTGTGAVDAARRRTYDVILMDLQMPDMSGLEATRIIRADPQCPNQGVPIVALTAHAFDQHRREALACGMNEYLTKPLKRDELFRILAQYSQREVKADP